MQSERAAGETRGPRPGRPRESAVGEGVAPGDPSAPAAGPRTIRYQEVGRHNSATSARVAYDGVVYDVSDFLDKHPGGRDILMPALGTDITEVFDAIHGDKAKNLLASAEARERVGIRRVGKLELSPEELNSIGLHPYQSRRRYAKYDPLGEELKREVRAYLRTNSLSTTKSRLECVLLLLLFYGLFGFGMYMAFLQGSLLWCLLLGPISTFMAVNPAHTAMHGGFSDSKILNKLASLLMDAGGYSAWGWAIEHLNHHETPHSTIDVQTGLESVVRFYGHQRHRPLHRWQMVYIWFAFLLYTPSQFLRYSYSVLFQYTGLSWKDKALHVAVKLVAFVLPITASFLLFEPLVALRNLALFAFSTGYASIFLLFIQHEDSYVAEDERESWAVRQVRTAATWNTRNRPLEWLLGYFNYHTEHHLFPSLNPALYPRIQPIVKRLCAKHGIRYTSVSYWELVKSQLAAWKKFSRAEPEIVMG